MKTKKIVIILLIVMVSSFIISGIAFNLTGGFKFTAEQNPEFNEEKTFDMNGITKLFINTSTTDVNFILTEDEDLKVYFYGEVKCMFCDPSYELNTSVTNNKVSINADYNNFSMFMFYSRINLDIYIPSDYEQDIEIYTSTGDVYIKDLTLNKLIVDTSTGDIDLKDLVFKTDADIDTSTGDVSVDISGDIDITTSTGDVDLIHSDSENFIIKIDTSTGKVNANLDNDASFYLQASTSTGKITYNLPITVQGNVDEDYLAGTVGDESSNEVTISTSTGDITIN